MASLVSARACRARCGSGQLLERESAEPMEFRHAVTGDKHCTVRFEARPYSDWGNYEAWKRAQTETL